MNKLMSPFGGSPAGGKKLTSSIIIITMVALAVWPNLILAEETASTTPATELIATPETTSVATSTPETAPDLVFATATEPSLTPTSIPDSAETPSSTPQSVSGSVLGTTTTPSLIATSTTATFTLDPEAGPSSTPETALSSTPETILEIVGTKFSEAIGTTGGILATPVIKALWEMQGPVAALLGTDDSADEGAQFLPSGQYQVSKKIATCAVVSDASGVADIDSVTSSIYYPKADFGAEITDGRIGCEQQKGLPQQMAQLAKEQGLALFCDTIQNNNRNLPGFYDISDFKEICGQEGELQKETAAVFCTDEKLLYNDLSGEYKIKAQAVDKAGASSNVLNGAFSYLELTAFETDFTNLNYGKAELNAIETVVGDAVWQEFKAENHSTLRNVGNTRLQMEIMQDDMGLGKTDGEWNIRYGTKVGADSLWKNYWPGETVLFDKILGLAQIEPVDFAITVLKFPKDDILDYSGKMTLNAIKAEHLVCQAPQ